MSEPSFIARGEPVAQTASVADFAVPQLLQQGTPLTKVSNKKGKVKRVLFRLDPDQGQIIWEGKTHRIIPLENIKELRSASDARHHREMLQLSSEVEGRWLTIVYTLEGHYKMWHVIADTADVFQMWDTTLHALVAVRHELMNGVGNLALREAVWEKKYWKSAAEQAADTHMSFEDVERLCRRLNISPSREDLIRRFQQADVHNRGYLDFPDFQRFVKLLKTRPELDRLHKKLAAPHQGRFTYAAFEHFMREHQKSKLSDEELHRIFQRHATAAAEDNLLPPVQLPLDITLPREPYGTPAADGAELSWSLQDFTSFLFSSENAARDFDVIDDMTRPLSEYYISSSHNTYLIGHQLVGYSTIEGYIRALLHSCRSVELDIYDGDAEPVIYHGKTLTSKVPLREVCNAIQKYAFVVSPYPIIISAEVHCSVPQQEMIVSIMREVFGDALVSAPVEGRPRIEILPSPEDLKGRVLLKAKNLYVSEHEAMQPKDITVNADSSTSPEPSSSTDNEVFSEIKQELKLEFKEELRKAKNVLRRRSPSTSPAPAAKAPKVRMSLALAALLVYTVGVKCRGLNKKEHYAPEHVFSLSEGTANKMYKQSGVLLDLIKHNRTHLVRVYPKGTRLASTNYEPHRYWSAGAQLVAINWQTCDLGYMINHAMFQRNSRLGYVLKPLALRTSDKGLLSKLSKHVLDLNVISAQQLPRPKDSNGREIIDKTSIDPYIEVSLHIPDWSSTPLSFPPNTSPSSSSATSSAPVPASPRTSSKVLPTTTPATTVSYRTATVKANGFNPVWEEPLSLPFSVVGDMRELVFLRVAVKEEGDDDREPLAVFCTSLGSLQEGFRHLPLADARADQYMFSTLFVHIAIRDA
ncbi:PLC-like phosphodiesterase [Auriscalpium vulgare]|uniref:PLC-like phosphodiesterase n=1 Tax=Auriscalpium vulgare TaxID=40419 RepID=A0ACB8S259_9AGAM|nr:PLC-like phosphodiesterase [Auriscalpium vulgare]